MSTGQGKDVSGPRFGTRTLLWLCIFVAVNCGMIVAVHRQAPPPAFYVAFGAGLLAIAGFVASCGQPRSLRPMGLTAVAAVIATSVAMWRRGAFPMMMLVGPIKIETDLSAFASTPVGCALTAVGFVAFFAMVGGSISLLISPPRKVGLIALILLALWAEMFCVGSGRRPEAVAPLGNGAANQPADGQPGTPANP